MNRKYLIVVLATVLVPLTASTRELSLGEAMKLALSHSYKVKADRTRADAFRSGLAAASAERLPTLSASGVASYRSQVAQLNVELPTGDVLSRDIGLKENYQVDLKLTLPVFTGGRVSGGIDMAGASRDYYTAIARATEDEIILVARVEFLALYRADRMVDAARASLKRVNTALRDVQSLYEAGAADSINILDAHLAASEAESRLQTAISTRRQKEIDLAVLLGLDATESIQLNFSPEPPLLSATYTAAIDSAKPELMAASSAIELSRSIVKLNKAELMPTLAVFGGYSWGKPNLDMFEGEFNDYFTVGATATWSFNIGSKSVKSIQKARHQYTAAEFDYNRTQEQLDRRARVILERLKLAVDDYRTALEHHRIASDNYRLAGEKHREGVLSSNRLVEIEAALSQAEASLASTQADYYIVQSQYYHATGSSLLKEGT